jgi:hypothetical protein
MDIDSDMMKMQKQSQQLQQQHQSGLDVFEKLDDIHRSISHHSLADVTALLAQAPSDYSYFDFDKIKLIDLPRHLKRIAHTIALADKTESLAEVPLQPQQQSATKSTTVRNKKEAPRLDFTQAQQIEVQKFFKITKKAIYLCDKTIEKRSEKPLRLEQERNFDFNAKTFFQPFDKTIKAKILVDSDAIENLLGGGDEFEYVNQLRSAQQQQQNPRYGIDDDDEHMGMGLGDDFEIPSTARTNEPFFTQASSEFGPTQNGMMMNMMDMDQMPMHDDLNSYENMRLEGDHLVQAPLQVNALNIEYAKYAKNIDVRRLKQIIWSLLCAEHDKVKFNRLCFFYEIFCTIERIF